MLQKGRWNGREATGSRRSPLQTNKWRGRNFEGVLSLTRDNKVHYADMHGYTYEDASWIVSGAAWGPVLRLYAGACSGTVLRCDVWWGGL